jgi:hypothetical protein
LHRFPNGKPQLLPDPLVDNQCPHAGVHQGVRRKAADFRAPNNALSGIAYITGVGRRDFFLKSSHTILLCFQYTLHERKIYTIFLLGEAYTV